MEARETDPTLPSGFSESLRGFEDLPLSVTRGVAFGEATYHYPFIIDHGWASTLWILPSLFVRQLDLELFASAAQGPESRVYGAGERHEAAGGFLSLRTVFGPWTPTLTSQLSRRLTDDDAWSLLLVLSN